MANHVTTEWEDIHVKLGNYVPTEKQTESNDTLQKIAMEAIEKYDPLENKTVEQLNELEDEEDDEVLRAYKEKRLKEMREFASKPHFGKVYELSKQDFIQEVTNAPKEVYVVLHLYQNYIMDCKVLDKIFEDLARKFVLVKFMRIRATSCVEGIPDSNVPGVIIYHNNELMKQFLPCTYYFGGEGHISAKKVEWILASLKVLKTDIEEDPFEDEEDDEGYKITKKDKRQKEDFDSDSEDDVYGIKRKGKEYGFNFIRK